MNIASGTHRNRPEPPSSPSSSSRFLPNIWSLVRKDEMVDQPSRKRPAQALYVPPAKRTLLTPTFPPNFQKRASGTTLRFQWVKTLPRAPGDHTPQPYCFLDLAGDSSRQRTVAYMASHIQGGHDHDLECVEIRPNGAPRSRKWSSVAIDRKGTQKPIYSHVSKKAVADFLLEVCGKLGQANMAPATCVALRNAAIAHHRLDPEQVHYFLENPTMRGNPSGCPSSVSYVASIAYVDKESPEFQNIQIELGVDQVSPDADIPRVPGGIRWVQGGVRTDNVHLRRCDFGYDAVPAGVRESSRPRHERCVDALRWLVYTFDGSCGSARSIKQQLWEAQRLLGSAHSR